MKLYWPLQDSVLLCDRTVTGSQDLTQKEAGPHFSQEKKTGADSGILIKPVSIPGRFASLPEGPL